jgi:WXG100 family type VII secretion target
MKAPLCEDRMTDRLRVEYDSLSQIIGAFAQEAIDLEELFRRIGNAAEDLRRAGWIGSAAVYFFSEYAEVANPATWRLIGLLWDISELTKQLVDYFHSVEEQVSQLFRLGVNQEDITTQIVALEKALEHAANNPTEADAVAARVDKLYAEGMTQIMGRNIDLKSSASASFSAREKLLIVEAFSQFPKTLRDKGMLDRLARYQTLPKAAAEYDPDSRVMNVTDEVYSAEYMRRYGIYSKEAAFQANILHEMAHSVQYDQKGNFSKLMEDYATQFGWKLMSPGGSVWWYKGNPGDLPGADDPSSMYPSNKMSAQEDMAEAVVFYRYAPERLSIDRYNWVKDNIYDGQEFK